MYSYYYKKMYLVEIKNMSTSNLACKELIHEFSSSSKCRDELNESWSNDLTNHPTEQSRRFEWHFTAIYNQGERLRAGYNR